MPSHLIAVLASLIAAVALAAAARAEPVRIVAIGDSNIAGYAVDPDENYPAKVERALRARGLDVSVVNEGVGGDTCAGVLARLDSDVPDGTHLVLLSIGENDLKGGAPREALTAPWREIESRLARRGIALINLDTAAGFHGAAYGRPELHIETNTPAFGRWHLNAKGYEEVVARTLPEIEARVRQLARR